MQNIFAQGGPWATRKKFRVTVDPYILLTRAVRNEPTNQPLLSMPEELRTQISAEIKRVQSEIDQQKSLIKDNVANTLVVETAKQEMKALHTRLSVLEANLAREIAKTDATQASV
jgi:hypothetical protein